jgi:nitroimidazol reductase NimA-like FMN-containing flavoprotein (pyridoxamine 5'-phosphate oxidase superfamily)
MEQNFRPMRRFKQALSEEACREVLRQEKRGTLAMVGDGGYPYAVPINFYYDERENRIFFHSAKSGHKADAMRASDKVCFTVHDAGEQRGDWSFFVRSVIVFGRVKPVTDPGRKYEKAKAFGMKYYPSEEEVEREIEKDLDRAEIMEILIEHASGKLVHEK